MIPLHGPGSVPSWARTSQVQSSPSSPVPAGMVHTPSHAGTWTPSTSQRTSSDRVSPSRSVAAVATLQIRSSVSSAVGFGFSAGPAAVGGVFSMSTELDVIVAP